jgi:hypothetical protein
VAVGRGVAVGDGMGVTVGVLVGGEVAVAEAVRVGEGVVVDVAVLVGMAVLVDVAVGVAVEVAIGVGVSVGVGVRLGRGVRVGVGVSGTSASAKPLTKRSPTFGVGVAVRRRVRITTGQGVAVGKESLRLLATKSLTALGPTTAGIGATDSLAAANIAGWALNPSRPQLAVSAASPIDPTETRPRSGISIIRVGRERDGVTTSGEAREQAGPVRRKRSKQ